MGSILDMDVNNLPASVGDVIECTELIAEYAHMLNPKAAEILHNKESDTLNYKVDGKEYKCMCISAQAIGQHNIQVAAEYLINEINKIDDEDRLIASLVPLSAMRIAEFNTPLPYLRNGVMAARPPVRINPPDTYVVYSFIHIKPLIVNGVESNNPSDYGAAYTVEGDISNVIFKD